MGEKLISTQYKVCAIQLMKIDQKLAMLGYDGVITNGWITG